MGRGPHPAQSANNVAVKSTASVWNNGAHFFAVLFFISSLPFTRLSVPWDDFGIGCRELHLLALE